MRYQAFKGTQEVIGGGDYFTFDSTLQSEVVCAQSLQELLLAVINNQAAQMLDIDPSMLSEISI
jgi:hypothetical protein